MRSDAPYLVALIGVILLAAFIVAALVQNPHIVGVSTQTPVRVIYHTTVVHVGAPRRAPITLPPIDETPREAPIVEPHVAVPVEVR